MTETNGLAAINTFKNLRMHYISEGFTIERVLTSEQRKKCDAKAHVFQEYAPHVEFKYIPIDGRHHYLFAREGHTELFDKYCRIV